jgi:hypothetical protein
VSRMSGNAASSLARHAGAPLSSEDMHAAVQAEAARRR